VRLPIATDLKTSISDTTKDARLINAHTETRGGVTRVKKRPGALATGWDFTTPIQSGFGGSLLYLIYGDEFSVIDVSSPPPASVAIGDLVGGYYAMIDNPPTSPGGGDAYWSASPPGSCQVCGDVQAGLWNGRHLWRREYVPAAKLSWTMVGRAARGCRGEYRSNRQKF
jgi:hypothetical protein